MTPQERFYEAVLSLRKSRDAVVQLGKLLPDSTLCADTEKQYAEIEAAIQLFGNSYFGLRVPDALR